MVGMHHITNKFRIVVIDIRADHINRWRQCPPQSDVPLYGSAAGILDAWDSDAALRQLRRRIAEPYIDVERDPKLRLARGGNLIDIARLMIELKDFICVGTEELAPRAGLLAKNRKQVGWNLTGKCFVRSSRK